MSSYLLYGSGGYFDDTDDDTDDDEGGIRRRSRPLRTRRDPLVELDDVEFRLHYRMSKPSFRKLLALVEDALDPETARKGSLTAAQQLACTLHVLGHNTMQSDEGRIMGCSQTTIHRVFRRVLNELVKLRDVFVKWPDAREMRESKDYFYAKYDLNEVVGVIDGTHVRILAPSENEADFVNRKGYHSVNVGAICDHNLKFIWFNASFPGSCHDSRVFKTSQLYRDLQNGSKTGVLLGDSAYAAEVFLRKPMLNARTPQEQRENARLCAARSHIEHAFGVLKRQFHVLHSECRYDVETTVSIVTASMILRNYCIGEREEVFDEVIDSPDLSPIGSDIDL